MKLDERAHLDQVSQLEFSVNDGRLVVSGEGVQIPRHAATVTCVGIVPVSLFVYNLGVYVLVSDYGFEG